MTADTLRTLANLLDDDDVFDLVVGAMASVRDKAPRVRDDVGEAVDADSAAVLNYVIDVVRFAATANSRT